MLILILYTEMLFLDVEDVIGPFYNEAEIMEWKRANPQYDWKTETRCIKSPDLKCYNQPIVEE